jgi:predicted lipoprotein
MRGRFSTALFACCLALSGCVPWTVRPIEQAETGPFDAKRYVDGIWTAKVLPAVAGAADLTSPAARRIEKSILVKGEGKVVRVDESSRARLMLVDLPPFDGKPDVALQLGPVIRGTALRDALPFIQFSQFVNQLDYARAGNALNDRAENTLATLSAADIAGAGVTFAGAAAPPSGDAPLEIVPVTLSVQRGPK